MQFTTAYKLGANEKVDLQVSTNGTNWTTIATYTGSTVHWSTLQVDLSAYRKTSNVLFRFNARAQGGLLFYLDDVYISAWPAILSASVTYFPANPLSGTETTFIGSYTAVAAMPVIYLWDFGDSTTEPPTTSPNIVHTFVNSGDYTVKLTVQNPYDSTDNAVFSQSVHVNPVAGQHTLTIAVAPGGGGTTTPSAGTHSYAEGVVVPVTATPAAGYVFSSWSGACTGSGACSITMSADKTVTANFTQVTHNLTIAVTPTDGGTTSPSVGVHSYAEGSFVLITATPAAGYVFSSWNGACTGSGSCSVTMSSDKSVTANFTLATYTLGVTKVGTGTGLVTSTPGGINCGLDCSETYGYGTLVTLSATADAGSNFTGWSLASCPGTGICQVTMDAAKTITVNFTLNSYALRVSKSGTGTGLVTSAPAGINCGLDCSEAYSYGTLVTLIATADPSSTFTGWSLANCLGTGSCQVTMDAAKSVTVNFTLNTYALNVAIVGSGSVTLDPAMELYAHGTTVTLTPVPAEGYIFSGWSGANVSELVDIGDGSWTIVMNGAKSVTATFAQAVYYTLTTNVVGIGSVTKLPDQQTYLSGTPVQLTALADTGYTFFNWTDDANGNMISTTNPVTIIMDGSKTISAYFQLGTLRENFNAIDGWTEKGKATLAMDTGNYKEGMASIKLTMPSSEGYGYLTKSVRLDLSAPGEQGNLRFWVYLSNTGIPTNLQIWLSNDAAFKNYYFYNILLSGLIRGQWNLINLGTLNWLAVSKASWINPIVRIQFRGSGSGGVSYSFDGLTSGGVLPLAGYSVSEIEMDVILSTQDLSIPPVGGWIAP
jgi:uncharacterized repeat protein (TIGR02543 family)